MIFYQLFHIFVKRSAFGIPIAIPRHEGLVADDLFCVPTPRLLSRDLHSARSCCDGLMYRRLEGSAQARFEVGWCKDHTVDAFAIESPHALADTLA